MLHRVQFFPCVIDTATFIAAADMPTVPKDIAAIDKHFAALLYFKLLSAFPSRTAEDAFELQIALAAQHDIAPSPVPSAV